MSKQRIICVVGPTASGKTEIGVKIAREVGGEVISADSMQIYRGMSIASAAPTAEETEGVPHHLVEFLDYGLSFTVADYVTAAREKIREIAARGKVPVIVGGTGLYISSLVNNIEFAPQENTATLRKRLSEELERVGAEEMLTRLHALDPAAAEKLHPSDTRRIIRAFEIYEATGMTPTEHNRASRENESPYNPIMIGINYKDRERLYERINLRVDKMVDLGLVEEARAAFAAQNGGGLHGAVQAIGHKELFPYFEGKEELSCSIERLKRSSRRYAKRQITWFSRDERINWIYRDCTPDVENAAIDIIKREG